MLDHFWIGQSRVGHVAVYGVASRKPMSSSRTATNGLVVAKTIISEEQIVHGSLAARHDLERFQERIDDSLAGLRIADRHRGVNRGITTESGVQEATGTHQFDRINRPFIEWNILACDHSKYVEHRSPHHRERGVEIPRMFAAGSREVDVHPT